MPADIALTIFNLKKNLLPTCISQKNTNAKKFVSLHPLTTYYLSLTTYYLKNVGNARFGLGYMPWRI